MIRHLVGPPDDAHARLVDYDINRAEVEAAIRRLVLNRTKT